MAASSSAFGVHSTSVCEGRKERKELFLEQGAPSVVAKTGGTETEKIREATSSLTFGWGAGSGLLAQQVKKERLGVADRGMTLLELP